MDLENTDKSLIGRCAQNILCQITWPGKQFDKDERKPEASSELFNSNGNLHIICCEVLFVSSKKPGGATLKRNQLPGPRI